MPEAVHDTLTGAVAGAVWGLVLGLTCAGAVVVRGSTFGGPFAPSSGDLALAFALIVAVNVGVHALGGAAGGLGYGLSGSEVVGIPATVVFSVAGWFLIGGGILGAGLSVLFAFYVIKAVDYKSA